MCDLFHTTGGMILIEWQQCHFLTHMNNVNSDNNLSNDDIRAWYTGTGLSNYSAGMTILRTRQEIYLRHFIKNHYLTLLGEQFR